MNVGRVQSFFHFFMDLNLKFIAMHSLLFCFCFLMFSFFNQFPNNFAETALCWWAQAHCLPLLPLPAYGVRRRGCLSGNWGALSPSPLLLPVRSLEPLLAVFFQVGSVGAVPLVKSAPLFGTHMYVHTKHISIADSSRGTGKLRVYIGVRHGFSFQSTV